MVISRSPCPPLKGRRSDARSSDATRHLVQLPSVLLQRHKIGSRLVTHFRIKLVWGFLHRWGFLDRSVNRLMHRTHTNSLEAKEKTEEKTQFLLVIPMK